MDNIKNEKYYIERIIKNIEFILLNTKDLSFKEFNNDEVLNSAICFKIVQISENCKQLPEAFLLENKFIPWKMIIGMRNRIVHDYGNVKFDIVYNTIRNDLPDLLIEIQKLLSKL